MPDSDPPPALIYEQLAGERLLDVPALASLDAERFVGLDAQSVAYRGMGPLDVVLDLELPAAAERVHPPYVPGADVPPATVEEYEHAGWDRERVDPRPDAR